MEIVQAHYLCKDQTQRLLASIACFCAEEEVTAPPGVASRFGGCTVVKHGWKKDARRGEFCAVEVIID